jgi:hypothetical protein
VILDESGDYSRDRSTGVDPLLDTEGYNYLLQGAVVVDVMRTKMCASAAAGS